MRKCQSADRNLCAGDDKIAALFIDIDGTCVVCQPYWDGAFAEFSKLMLLCKLGTEEEALEILRKVYYGSMPMRGFERARFGEALHEAYAELCLSKRKKQDPVIVELCKSIGSRPFFRKPEVFDHCLPVLARARHNFLLVAVTVGDREAQKYKIRQAGLDALFDHTIITNAENKAELVEEAIEDMGIDPDASAFIGNSIRSDGVCLSKTNFIYLPLETSLSRPGDALPESRFRKFDAKDWREVEERGIVRLLRKRQTHMEGSPGEYGDTQEEGCTHCGR